MDEAWPTWSGLEDAGCHPRRLVLPENVLMGAILYGGPKSWD